MSALREALAPGRVLVPYLTAFDPDPESFLEAAAGCCEGGAGALEVGVPHSDPVADGPVIQASHRRGLEADATLGGTLELIGRLKEAFPVPVVLFTYLNPLLAYGPERFFSRAAEAGVDGVLTLDCPPLEEPAWFRSLADAGLDPVVLVTPTTSSRRAERLAAAGRGFLYVVSRTGITGGRTGAQEEVARRVSSLRHHSDLPVAVGFGVRSREDAEALWAFSEAVVVGSALVSRLAGVPKDKRRGAAREAVEELCGTGPSAGEREESP